MRFFVIYIEIITKASILLLKIFYEFKDSKILQFFGSLVWSKIFLWVILEILFRWLDGHTCVSFIFLREWCKISDFLIII